MDLEAILALLLLGITMLVPIVTGLIVVAAILVAVVLLVRYASRRSQQAQEIREASQEWPSTSGVVVESHLDAYTGDVTRVRPKVTYTYTVAGQQFQGKQIRAGDKVVHPMSRRQGNEILDRYPKGTAVTVFYDPANPAESALER